MQRGIGFYTKVTLCIVLVLTILLYTLYQSRKVIEGPAITISSPADGATIATSTISIVGQVFNSSDISINGDPIVIDESGNFKEERILLPGLNIITIQAKNQFKRSTEKILQIVYKPQG